MFKLQNLTLLAAAALCFAQPAFSQSNAELVAQAIRPLPDDLKPGATVYRYDAETGERIVLRQGSNQVECQPRNDEGFTRCNPRVEGPRRDLRARLAAQGHSDSDIEAALIEAENAGTIPARTFGAMNYRLWETEDRIKLLYIISVPNASAAKLGYPTGGQRDNSLNGRGTPWMMREGTPGAHLMIPVNGTPLSNQPD